MPPVEFRRERYTNEFRDPRRGFETTRLTLELRWDPVTGESCRLLPPGSLPPPERQDVDALAARSQPTCPFCAGRIDVETPAFPAELWPEGRLRVGEAVAFPNLVPYAKWSSVSVYSPHRHRLELTDLTPALIADNLTAQLQFGHAVVTHDPSSSWVSINANHLPPSGSSIFHPHLQCAANPEPTTVQRRLAALGVERMREYAELERRSGERLIHAAEGVDWIAGFAPTAPAEIRAVVAAAELDDHAVAEIASGLSSVLALYDALGFQSFNLAVYDRPLLVRVIARAEFGPLHRSDAMWSERLHAEAATDLFPETVAERARPFFPRR
jgi:UDPglucose--hexose-1-phosphate uridylyltransferase